jgi:DNA-binding NtrC family response regulator
MKTARVDRVLLVEDDKTSLESITLFLERKGYDVISARDGAEALEHLADGISVVVTDFAMPEVDGLELLRAAREDAPHAAVIMITGHGSEDVAVQALQAGAFHYLTKPIDPDELLSLVRQACEKYRMATEITGLHQQLQEKYGFANIIGTSDAMRRVFEKVRMVADTRSTVLIEGASGTGKELVARALHYNSARRKKPFVALNCAALPEALVESELFGHERGAFTGAVDRRIGKFQAAEGGTLLIDEIGDMPLDLQSKLLRAIESRCITPIGSNQEIKVDARIVASTNRDLVAMAKREAFREDLFYRISVVNIKLPPLSERPGDIPLLVRAFIDELAEESRRPVRDITPAALARLQGYEWPGNVRQLRNVLESVIVTATREIIDVPDLPEPVRQARPVSMRRSLVKPGMTLEALEKEAIRVALRQTDGNRTRAAEQLGISLRTLQRKIKEYGL